MEGWREEEEMGREKEKQKREEEGKPEYTEMTFQNLAFDSHDSLNMKQSIRNFPKK